MGGGGDFASGQRWGSSNALNVARRALLNHPDHVVSRHVEESPRGGRKPRLFSPFRLQLWFVCNFSRLCLFFVVEEFKVPNKPGGA